MPSEKADPLEYLRIVAASLRTYLHPSRSGNVQLGVAETLNSLLFKYSEEFGGVVLAYLQPKVVGRDCKVLSGLYPFFHLKVTASMLIFCPKSGMKLDGKVNKLEKDHLGVLVLDVFNVSIAITDIRDDLRFQGTEDDPPNTERAWVSKADSMHAIRLGSFITFTVKSVQEAEQFIEITGSLQSPNTGCCSWLARRSGPRGSRSTAVVTPSRVMENGGISLKANQEYGTESRPSVNDIRKKSSRQDEKGSPERNHKFKRKKA